ncbi:MAG TPA: DNA alkylation repair protein [Planctomycetota bacterium]|nr:DNA alkylation repair protein [Planctomycetota bacterium]
MNFAREQSLLRQRLQAQGSPALAAARQQELGTATTFLGAGDDAIAAAATDLAAMHPQMGRAQMTAFVRTLWQSRIYELRAVGIELLAARASLLEPADLAFLEGLLADSEVDALAQRLAGDVIGVLVGKHKKLWKDLRRFAAASQDVLRRAAVRASRLPLLDDSEAFPRFVELAEPLMSVADAKLQEAIDELLAAAAAVHGDAVKELAARHGRAVKLPKKKVSKAASKPAAAAVADVLPQEPKAKKAPASKDAAANKRAGQKKV